MFSNLRKATSRENSFNRTPSGELKGVTKKGNKFIAQISVEGAKTHLGVFDTETAAAEAYDVAAKQHFGEFAYVNFPN